MEYKNSTIQTSSLCFCPAFCKSFGIRRYQEFKNKQTNVKTPIGAANSRNLFEATAQKTSIKMLCLGETEIIFYSFG